jgi:hypothetical protein
MATTSPKGAAAPVSHFNLTSVRDLLHGTAYDKAAGVSINRDQYSLLHDQMGLLEDMIPSLESIADGLSLLAHSFEAINEDVPIEESAMQGLLLPIAQALRGHAATLTAATC